MDDWEGWQERVRDIRDDDDNTGGWSSCGVVANEYDKGILMNEFEL